MLPHVGGQQDGAHFGRVVHQRVVLVRGRGDLQLAVLQDQPGPARTELTGAGRVEVSLELVHAAQFGVDLGGQFGRGLAARADRGQQFPEQAVVPHAAAVVADRLRQLGHDREDLFQRLALRLGRGVDELVQVVDVGLMVLVVVEGHRLLVDGRLQRVIGVGQRGQGEGHGETPLYGM